MAALDRLTTLLNNPGRVLKEIEARITESFRRLYRNRNIVLHGGKTDAVGLRACLRISAPWGGAGLDRIAHTIYTEGLNPIELAARARIRLDSLDSGKKALKILSPLLHLAFHLPGQNRFAIPALGAWFESPPSGALQMSGWPRKASF